MAKHLSFPEGFLWGASTSAHQVEGHTHTDWDQWEKLHAAKLAVNAPRLYGRLDQWPELKRQATTQTNYIAGAASDHWNHYAEDYKLAAEMGLTAFRLSVDWARLEPRPGHYDQAALKHYRKMLLSVRRHGMEPFLTVWHWTIPTWLADAGGWTDPRTPSRLAALAEWLARDLGDLVKFWITLNEPNVYTERGYLSGDWPPGRRDLRAWRLANHNLAEAHRQVYRAIKAVQPEAQIGLSNNVIPYSAYRRNWINKFLLSLFNFHWNHQILRRTRDCLDFIGVNHYFRYRINLGFNKIGRAKRSDMGWELYPRSMYAALVGLQRYRKPIYITEHGLADAQDRYRAWFISESLRSVHRAMRHGCDVRGYFHWSLLDNFEWSDGKWPRFGLIEVDYSTQQRRPRPSAKTYATIISRNGLDK